MDMVVRQIRVERGGLVTWQGTLNREWAANVIVGKVLVESRRHLEGGKRNHGPPWANSKQIQRETLFGWETCRRLDDNDLM
jgi:hypothetical protein